MTLEQVKTILSGTGLPVAYYQFPEGQAPALPWIVYYEASSNNFAADGIAYAEIKHIVVELYSRYKEPQTEAALQTALTGAGLFWQKNETWLQDELCYMITYDMEV